MNDFKRNILAILQEDCRTPINQIAIMTGETEEKVAEAIKNLEDDHIILKYAPVINWANTPVQRVEGIIEVRVTPQRDMGFDALAERLYCFEEVKSVYLMSGSYDLFLLVQAPTLQELGLFVSEKLSTLDTVTGTSTSFVLKRYKQDGVVFDKFSGDKRLMVQP